MTAPQRGPIPGLHIPNSFLADLANEGNERLDQIILILSRLEGHILTMDQREREAFEHYRDTAEKIRDGFVASQALNTVYRDFYDTLTDAQQKKLSAAVEEAQDDREHDYDLHTIERATADLDVLDDFPTASTTPPPVANIPTATVPGEDGSQAVPDPDPTTLPTDPVGHDPHAVPAPQDSGVPADTES